MVLVLVLLHLPRANMEAQLFKVAIALHELQLSTDIALSLPSSSLIRRPFTLI